MTADKFGRHGRRSISRLPAQDIKQMIESMAKENHHRLATLWRLTVETWFRRQGLISVR